MQPRRRSENGPLQTVDNIRIYTSIDHALTNGEHLLDTFDEKAEDAMKVAAQPNIYIAGTKIERFKLSSDSLSQVIADLHAQALSEIVRSSTVCEQKEHYPNLFINVHPVENMHLSADLSAARNGRFISTTGSMHFLTAFTPHPYDLDFLKVSLPIGYSIVPCKIRLG